MYRNSRRIARLRDRKRFNHIARLITRNREIETQTLVAVDVQEQSVIPWVDDEVAVYVRPGKGSQSEW